VNDLRRGRVFYPKADLEFAAAPADAFAQRQDFAERVVRSWRSDASVPIPLGMGRANLVWAFTAAGSAFVLKAPGVAHAASDFRHEAAVTEVAAAHGVPVPTTRAVDDAFLIADRAGGASLKEIDEMGDEPAVTAAISAMARALRAAHAIEMPGYGLLETSRRGSLGGSCRTWSQYLTNRIPEHLTTLEAHEVIDTTLRREVQRSLVELRELPDDGARLLHGDCGPQNAVVAADGALCLLDWEDAVAGDPTFEIAQWATFQPERRWQRFFDAYFESGSWSPNRIFWLYHLRITLAKTTVRARLRIADIPGRPSGRTRIEDSLARLSAS
jgi:aminoglycoside phosphotransferase (APT) family kinase protein